MCLANQDWLLDPFGEWNVSCDGSKANRGASLIAKVVSYAAVSHPPWVSRIFGK